MPSKHRCAALILDYDHYVNPAPYMGVDLPYLGLMRFPVVFVSSPLVNVFLTLAMSSLTSRTPSLFLRPLLLRV